MNLINAGRIHSTGPSIEKIQFDINLWIARVLMVGYAVFAADRIYHIVRGDSIFIMIITLVASLLSVFVHFRVLTMLQKNQANQAALWMMSANFVMLAIIQATDAGNSPLTGATYSLVTAVIASQMLTDRWSAVGVFAAFAGGSLIATFDYLLPGSRGGIDFSSSSLYIMLVINLLFVYLLLRPFATYQMNVKFLLAMTAMTITAVVISFVSVYLVVADCASSDATLLMKMQKVAIISGAFFVIVSGGASFFIARFISRPLVRMISNIQAISEKGDFSRTFDIPHQGEVSYLAHALNDMNSYFRQLTDAAEKVAQGDLTVTITPRSEQDLLGLSFSKMVNNLQQLVHLIMESAQHLASASDHLHQVVNNSNTMINAITQAVDQVLASEAGNVDGASFKQLAQAIDSIARGAQDQAGAVSLAAGHSTHISSSVDEMNQYMQAVKDQSLDAASNARDGVQIMDEMVEKIENIRTRVNQSGSKVAEMGERSQQIEEIVTLIGNIASQTNLLALNTAIEAARSSTHTSTMAEAILDTSMSAQAWLVAHLLQNRTEEMETDYFWNKLAERCHMDDFCVTDNDGVVTISKNPDMIGFRLPDDPKDQAYEFRQLIDKSETVICQPLQRRSFDNTDYKYVGVSRLDEPGIVQVGFDGSSISRYKSGGGVFSVISEEILQLSKQTQLATKEISDLNLNIQKTVNEAVTSMIEGEQEVNNGVNHVNHAREALYTILQGTDAVQQQLEQAATSVMNVENASRELSESMDSVSAVVEENTAATEEMAASTVEVSESIQMIAQLARDMSQDMDDINTALQSLSSDVQNAHQVIQNFKLNEVPATDL